MRFQEDAPASTSSSLCYSLRYVGSSIGAAMSIARWQTTAIQRGICMMQEIADHFGVRYSTVSRAVRWLWEGRESSPNA